MWFHHVSQSADDGGLTIAVNYCKDQAFPFHFSTCSILIKFLMLVLFYAGYDMQFDIKYAYFNFLQSIQYRSTPSPMLHDKLSEETDSGPDDFDS